MPLTHLKRHSGDAKVAVTAGFTPGGHIPAGYSYLQRSHSLVTPSRRSVPKGMSSPTRLEKSSNTNSPVSSPTSPVPLHHSNSTTSLTDNLSSPRFSKPQTDAHSISSLVAQLPPNPKIWTPSQVALYLTHVLGLTPKPVVEDVTAYVRKSRMGGKVFLRLREKDLEAEGLNLKWRTLMIEAVKKLRRDCLRGRIWGFEGGLQLPRQEDDVLDSDSIETHDTEQRIHTTAQGTLKRLRDQKGIRQMISGFENPTLKSTEDETSYIALERDNPGSNTSLSSLSSLPEGDGNIVSSRPQMLPIYGQGFVKSRAESYTSLNDSSMQHGQRDFTKEELEQLFGTLSDEEAEALANELLQDEELVMGLSTEDLQHRHHHSLSSLDSNTSSDVDLITPPCTEGLEVSSTDASLVDAVVLDEENLFSGKSFCPIDDRLPVESIKMGEITQPMIFRPGTDGVTNSYRSSTHEPEEIEALGMTTALKEENKFSTVRRMQHSPFIATSVLIDTTDDMFDSPKASHGAEKNVPTVLSTELDFDGLPPQHMRNMSAHEASGLSPYKPISQPMSRRPSQKRNGNASKEKSIGTVSKGSEGINGMQLTAMLMASGLADGPFTDMESDQDGKKAENESEWGITFSRKASRRGTLAGLPNYEKDTGTAAASRMAKLLRPADELGQENTVGQSDQTETSKASNLLSVPADVETSGSLRKRSMILVERKKFESLARRMGLLESQLADMATASVPPMSDLDKLDDDTVNQRCLPRANKPSRYSDVPSTDDCEAADTNRERSVTNRWNIARLLGVVPSYAVGLGAGVGFVLFNELLGKSRR